VSAGGRLRTFASGSSRSKREGDLDFRFATREF
jgi:hypothetical protein